MSSVLLARGCGVVGGLLWVARWLLLDDGSSLGAAAYWAGLALLVVALFDAGAGLVSRQVPWLRRLVGTAFVALCVSVLQVVSQGSSGGTVEGVAGLAAALLWAGLLLRGRPSPARPPGAHAGTHAR